MKLSSAWYEIKREFIPGKMNKPVITAPSSIRRDCKNVSLRWRSLFKRLSYQSENRLKIIIYRNAMVMIYEFQWILCVALYLIDEKNLKIVVQMSKKKSYKFFLLIFEWLLGFYQIMCQMIYTEKRLTLVGCNLKCYGRVTTNCRWIHAALKSWW